MNKKLNLFFEFYDIFGYIHFFNFKTSKLKLKKKSTKYIIKHKITLTLYILYLLLTHLI